MNLRGPNHARAVIRPSMLIPGGLAPAGSLPSYSEVSVSASKIGQRPWRLEEAGGCLKRDRWEKGAVTENGGGLVDATGGMAGRDERRLPLLSHLPATYLLRPADTAFGLRSRPEIQR